MSTIDQSDPAIAASTPRNGYGLAAMVLGIVAVVTAVNGFFFFALPMALSTAVLATVFGVLGRRRAQRGEADNGGQALAGLILGPIAIVLIALWISGFALLRDRFDGDRWDRWDRWDRVEEPAERG